MWQVGQQLCPWARDRAVSLEDVEVAGSKVEGDEYEMGSRWRKLRDALSQSWK